MTINQLYGAGVQQGHIRAFMQIKKEHMHPVTTLQLDSVGFGKSLRKLREDANISLREMARKLDLSAPFMSDCELGHRNLSTTHAILYIKHCKA